MADDPGQASDGTKESPIHVTEDLRVNALDVVARPNGEVHAEAEGDVSAEGETKETKANGNAANGVQPQVHETGNGVNGRHSEKGGLENISDPEADSGEEEDEEDEHDAEAGEDVDEGTDEASDTDDDDDEEEEEEEEDDEPALKYQKLGGSSHDLLEKDSASALAVSPKYIALGTHNGIVHVLDFDGNRIKSYRPHSASVNDMCLDSTSDFVATASVDGQVVIHSLSTPESYAFDMKRPMRTISLEPNFAKSGTRSFVCGGMAGNLILYEKGWFGHKDTVLHTGEGPIWSVRWRKNLIAWANDLGVKIYDTESQSRITYIDRPPNSPRADLFKCTLHWQDDSTLLVAWADYIKVARVRSRPRSAVTQSNLKGSALPPLMVEITSVFQTDSMISGIVPHPTNALLTGSDPQSVPTSFLVLAYIPPDTTFAEEATEDRTIQARKPSERPELRIISRSGEELSEDILSLSGYQTCGCNDYVLAEVPDSMDASRCYVILNPKNIVLAKPRDQKDHVAWLVERKRFEEALSVIETIQGEDIDAAEIGHQYIEHLVGEDEYEKASHLFPKVLGSDSKKWEDWIFIFAQKSQLQTIIPYVPTETPQLSRVVYDMILAHFLAHDRPTLLTTIRSWPSTIYDRAAVIVAVQSELNRKPPPEPSEANLLMDCLIDLFMLNRQPGKALPYCLRLRKPNVFDLIREHNLFLDVQDQALLLVEFDQELIQKKKDAGEAVPEQSPAIALLTDHVYSIPAGRVVLQLQARPYFLYLYLDALFKKDAHLASDFANKQVELIAEFATPRLIDFLRASHYYSLEKAYQLCKEKDYVPEMVFLLGRMGNNKQALSLIIERLADVNRAIDFAKEQNDDDLWEDLLRYSETRPAFIRGLLENVGAEINPIRLIRRIKNGLEIPGLKEALIKILQDFNLQISLLEGCRTILNGDCMDLAKQMQRGQEKGFFGNATTKCPICSQPLYIGPNNVVLLFLCRHAVHAHCVDARLADLPRQPDPILSSVGGPSRGLSGKIAFASMIKARLRTGCPVCHQKDEGGWTVVAPS